MFVCIDCTEPKVEALVAWIRETRTFGPIEVHDVEWRFSEDEPGKDFVTMDLVISDPPPGERLWPYDDSYALKRAIRDKSHELKVRLALYIRTHSLSSGWVAAQ